MINSLFIYVAITSVALAFPGGHLYHGGVYQSVQIPDYIEEARYAGEMAREMDRKPRGMDKMDRGVDEDDLIDDKMDRGFYRLNSDSEIVFVPMFVPRRGPRPMMNERDMMSEKEAMRMMMMKNEIRKKPFKVMKKPMGKHREVLGVSESRLRTLPMEDQEMMMMMAE